MRPTEKNTAAASSRALVAVDIRALAHALLRSQPGDKRFGPLCEALGRAIDKSGATPTDAQIERALERWKRPERPYQRGWRCRHCECWQDPGRLRCLDCDAPCTAARS